MTDTLDPDALARLAEQAAAYRAAAVAVSPEEARLALIIAIANDPSQAALYASARALVGGHCSALPLISPPGHA